MYALWLDREPETFSLQKEEVSEVKWFDFQECMEKVEKNEIPNCIFTEELKMVDIVANTGIRDCYSGKPGADKNRHTGNSH